eukprot:c15066_g2_i1 orf=78-251(+)
MSKPWINRWKLPSSTITSFNCKTNKTRTFTVKNQGADGAVWLQRSELASTTLLAGAL